MSHHLVIMAAGTGGHVIPGLAVAMELRRRGWSVSWLGTRHGIENRLVPPTGLPLDTVAFSGLRGKGLAHAVMGVFLLLGAFLRCLHVLRRRSADAVLGMGGYVCFPGGVMAALLGRPLMLVNADASMLMSNRALLPFARRVAFGFDGEAARETLHSVVTGNPVRAEIEALPAPGQRFAHRSGPLRVLVVGGSLGARALNDCLPQALARWPAGERPVVRHQTGGANLDAVLAGYAAAGLAPGPTLRVEPFIDDMAQALGECDVVVCRAGAVTVSELCAAGVASVLVPLVVRTTAHQRDNASFLAANGAAVHLAQSELTPERLHALLVGFQRSTLLTMAQRARLLARPRAAARVADEIERMVGVGV